MKVVKGDILTTHLPIIHGCNLSGGFGAGVAGAIAKMYPECRQEYLLAIEQGYNDLGDFILWEEYPDDDFGAKIFNLFTQINYGNGGKFAYYTALVSGLTEIVSYYSYKAYAIPQIGCGLGGLNWDVVKELLDEIELLNDVEFVVYTI